MILSAGLRAFVCAEPIDMRKSIDGLAALVAPLLGRDVFSGGVFVFVGKRGDKVKLLVWDRHGFWLLYKRLERGRFASPRGLTAHELPMADVLLWLEGIDLKHTRRFAVVDAQQVA